jgi:ATP-dependent Clp protease protease subunit
MSSTADNVLINTDARLFYISDDVDSASIGKMCFNLLYLLKQDDDNESKERDFKREPIKIYVNSYGGEVYDMWALIDIIEKSKTPIYTYCTGYAMSAAFKIFLAGHKRFGTKHSTFMYHQMNCYRYGKYQDLVEDRKEMDFLNTANEQYVIERTKIPQEYINEIREKKRDTYFHADEALMFGIIDEII